MDTETYDCYNCLLNILVDTIQELHTTIQNAVKAMRNSDYPITAVVSGSELFSRFITLGKFDDKTMAECKEIMVHRGQVFLKKLLDSRRVIAIKGAQYINDGCVSILAISPFFAIIYFR